MSSRGRRLLALCAAVTTASVISASPADAKAASIADKIAAAQKAANAAAAQLNQAMTALGKAQADVTKFRAQSAENQQKITQLQQRLKVFAVREYTTGGRAADNMLIGNASQVARNGFLIRTVTLDSVDQLEAYRVLRADEADTQAALDARLRDRQAAVSRAKAIRAQVTSQLAALGKAMKAQKSGLRVLATGPWVCPVQGPHAFSNDWGQPRSGGRRHKGNDILAPYGTPVVASVAGSVIDHDSGLGGKGYFLHGVDGNTYYGAHLSRFGATGRVAQGQVVGYVGTSGNARGGPAHLHFEIHPGNGAAVNPYGTLRAYC